MLPSNLSAGRLGHLEHWDIILKIHFSIRNSMLKNLQVSGKIFMSRMDNRHWCRVCYVNALRKKASSTVLSLRLSSHIPSQLVPRGVLVGVRAPPLFIILKVCYLQFIYLSL